jgi:hypothetical protein
MIHDMQSSCISPNFDVHESGLLHDISFVLFPLFSRVTDFWCSESGLLHVLEYEVMGLENKKIVLRFLLSCRPNFSVAAGPNYVKGLQPSLQFIL